MLRKRSITLAGHATSITLEPEFWTEIEAIAAGRGVSLARLIGEIDRGRGADNLSSALRVFVLKTIKNQP